MVKETQRLSASARDEKTNFRTQMTQIFRMLKTDKGQGEGRKAKGRMKFQITSTKWPYAFSLTPCTLYPEPFCYSTQHF